ncbi:MAG: zf-HC2 domain-containing protein [Firmicutes bacterium]|nr:zf-HC2 domain-containing protein [Bacillota bacterium]
MNCREALQKLEAYLDGELQAEAGSALEQHLRDCPACSAELTKRRDLFELLEDLEPSPLPFDFTSTVLKGLDHHARGGWSLLWPWLRLPWSGQQFVSLTFAVGTTACLMAAVTVLFRWGNQSGLLAGLGDRFQVFWLGISTTVSITGTWLSQVW